MADLAMYKLNLVVKYKFGLQKIATHKNFVTPSVHILLSMHAYSIRIDCPKQHKQNVFAFHNLAFVRAYNHLLPKVQFV